MAIEDQKPIMQRDYTMAITGATISIEDESALNAPQTPPQPPIEEQPPMEGKPPLGP